MLSNKFLLLLVFKPEKLGLTFGCLKLVCFNAILAAKATLLAGHILPLSFLRLPSKRWTFVRAQAEWKSELQIESWLTRLQSSQVCVFANLPFRCHSAGAKITCVSLISLSLHFLSMATFTNGCKGALKSKLSFSLPLWRTNILGKTD